MMLIVESRTWALGRFTIQQRPRFDAPAWPQYLVYLGDKLIGKSYSWPDEGCCRWLQHQRADAIRYAEPSAPQHRHSRSIAKARAFSLSARKDGAG